MTKILDRLIERTDPSTSALGGDYRVVISGLDQPIQWIRSGTLEVTIFVPYRYDVVPTSISSYSHCGSKGENE